MSLTLGRHGEIQFHTKNKNGSNERVHLERGDVIGIGQVPHQFATLYGIYEVDRAVIDGEKAHILRFPYHADRRYKLEEFAGHGMTFTLAEHAGAKTEIIGDEYRYVDETEECIQQQMEARQDPFGSAYEGC